MTNTAEKTYFCVKATNLKYDGLKRTVSWLTGKYQMGFSPEELVKCNDGIQMVTMCQV